MMKSTRAARPPKITTAKGSTRRESTLHPAEWWAKCPGARSPNESRDGRPRRAQQRRALSPVRREREGLRDLHARSRRAHRQLERGRAADQGLDRGGDPRPALLDLLHARRAGQPPPRKRAAHRQERWALR